MGASSPFPVGASNPFPVGTCFSSVDGGCWYLFYWTSDDSTCSDSGISMFSLCTGILVLLLSCIPGVVDVGVFNSFSSKCNRL